MGFVVSAFVSTQLAHAPRYACATARFRAARQAAATR